MVLVHGIERMLQRITEEHELDMVLCDFGASLGPFCHATAAAVDAIVVPVAPRAAEAAAMRSLAQALQRWRAAPSHTSLQDPFSTLGFVIVRSSGAIEVGLEQLAAAYHRELSGEHLGTIKEFPSLASIARNVHKPELELTMADGAIGSLSEAVLDLRRQYEALATRFIGTAALLDENRLLEILPLVLEPELYRLSNELDALVPRPATLAIEDIEIGSIEVCRGGLRILGKALLNVKPARPRSLRFDVEVERDHETAALIHRFEIDASLRVE